jgi:phosphatidylglycerol:prolipoprotein diacylglycerol transferase
VITAFSIALALSVLSGLFWLAWASPEWVGLGTLQDEHDFRVRFDMGLSVLLGGLIGARLAFIIAHWSFYIGRPIEMLKFWQGGLSWSGAAIGGLLALVIFALVTKRSFWSLADHLAAPVAFLAAGLWIGCLVDGCAYGIGGQTGPLAITSSDMFGVISSRWPTQIVGAACSLLILLGVFLLRRWLKPPGLMASLVLTLLAAMMLALSFTRGDPVGLLWGLRLDMLGSGFILIAGLAGLIFRLTKQ